MKAFHSFSNSQSTYLLGISRKKFRSPFGVFRNNEYIKKLNYLLALELGVLDLYSRLQDSPWQSLYERCLDNHREIAGMVNNLILSNHGIPNKEATTLTTELSLLATRLGKQLGPVLSAKASTKICLTMEHSLRKRYCELIEMAPFSDRSQLNQILFMTKANLISLHQFQRH